MLTNERIQQLKDYIYREFRTDNVEVDERKFDDISDCLDELLSARTRIAELEAENREWREDSERLHMGYIVNHEDGLVECRYCHNYNRGPILVNHMEWCPTIQHAALLEKYGKDGTK